MREQLPSHQDPARTRPPEHLRRVLSSGNRTWTGSRAGPCSHSTAHAARCTCCTCTAAATSNRLSKHHWNFARWLIDELGCTLTFPMYPLEPKYDHRAIWPMVRHSYARFPTPCAPRDRVIFGDSAGGPCPDGGATAARHRRGAARPDGAVLAVARPGRERPARGHRRSDGPRARDRRPAAGRPLVRGRHSARRSRDQPRPRGPDGPGTDRRV